MDHGDFIVPLTPTLEERIRRNPSLNIDTFIVPSPFIEDRSLDLDREHSYVWDEEGELLGYVQVYANPDRTRFHIYKQVTSPFGRGKGVGSAFLNRLSMAVSPEAVVYLYVWEKQHDTILFFANKGFAPEGTIVYRKLIFNRMATRARDIKRTASTPAADRSTAEELGKTRHDARKTLRLLSDMVNMLAIDNSNKIIEDINRETTALINMLNSYRDTAENYHDVNVKELLVERIIPYIELAPVPCEVRLSIAPRVPAAYGHYLDVGRALVNLVANSLDAIREAGRPGVIAIRLAENDGRIQLRIEDNGAGVSPERLAAGPDGVPAFVGSTTKDNSRGEGLGTRQIYATFGAPNILVESSPGAGTAWTISLPRRPAADNPALRVLEARYAEFRELVEYPVLTKPRDRRLMSRFIWQTRKMEILSWDLIGLFSKYNNIREVFRDVLAYRYGGKEAEQFRADLNEYRIDSPETRDWLLDLVRMIRRNEQFLVKTEELPAYQGILFKSYGQSVDKTVIFTMDPTDGRFFAADRKLAEHVDFAPYLGRERDDLLRGELAGDLQQADSPISLGVWTIRTEEDARRKLRLVRSGAAKLIELGVRPDKKLIFYPTTYRHFAEDFNTYLTLTLRELAFSADADLDRYLSRPDDEIPDFVVTD